MRYDERPSRLSQGYIKGLKKAGRYGDGRGNHGLSLLVQVNIREVAKYWQQRIKRGVLRDGSDRYSTVSLGRWPDVTLDTARELAFDNWKAVRDGIDLTPERTRDKLPLFHEVAAELIAMRAPRWKHPKTETLWRQRLGVFAFPKIGAKPIDTITTADVVKVLLPIWPSEKGRTLAIYMKVVFDWAIGLEYRTSNPANPKVLSNMLPGTRAEVVHHEALPYVDAHDMLVKIQEANAPEPVKACLTLLTFTGTRSDEARGAVWSEFDLEARTWSLPDGRRKKGKGYVIPLSKQAMALIEALPSRSSGSPLLFPSRTGGEIADSTPLVLLRKLDIPSTVHGLRSSFRDWVAECTDASFDVAEAAIGHKVGGATVDAYRRTQYFDKRVDLMQAWADYVSED